jgi:hypothetical protein
MTEQVDPAAADTPVGWELSQGYLQPNTTMHNLFSWAVFVISMEMKNCKTKFGKLQ